MGGAVAATVLAHDALNVGLGLDAESLGPLGAVSAEVLPERLFSRAIFEVPP
jgi:hypothetical protein